MEYWSTVTRDLNPIRCLLIGRTSKMEPYAANENKPTFLLKFATLYLKIYSEFDLTYFVWFPGKARGFFKAGDAVIVLTGWRPGSGYTNTMRVVLVA